MFNYTSDYWMPIDYDNAYSFKLNYAHVNGWKIENFLHDNCPGISNLIIQFIVKCTTSIIYSIWDTTEATLNYDCVENFYWFIENELIKIPAEKNYLDLIKYHLLCTHKNRLINFLANLVKMRKKN